MNLEMHKMLDFFFLHGFSILNIVLEFVCLSLKLIILGFLYKKVPVSNRNKSYYYLVIIILSAIFTSFTLGLHHFSNIFTVPTFLPKMFFRMECATLTIQFFALLCFFKNLSSKPISRRIINVFFIPTAVFVAYYAVRSLATPFVANLGGQKLSHFMINFQSSYLLFLGVIILGISYRNYKVETLGILRRHISTLAQFFMLPYLFAKLFEAAFVSVSVNPPAAATTTIILSWMLYYCSRKLIGLRFMNIGSHVESGMYERFSFVDNFKEVLDQLGSVSAFDELVVITKNFIEKSFNISPTKVSLCFKSSWLKKQNMIDPFEQDKRRLYIEKIFSSQSENFDIVSFVNESKILIRDELEFSHFYNTKESSQSELKSVVEFLRTIDAGIFLPVYSDSKVVAYIIIDHDARSFKSYTDLERDEMLIYANYLGSIIYLLANMNLDAILQREKEVKVQAYRSEKKYQLLKKCVYPMLSSSKTRRIGVLTYKNKKFGYCNQAAKDILKVDLNRDKGLEFTQNMLKLGAEVDTYYSSKKLLFSSPKGDEQFLVSAAPNLERSNTVMTVSNPTIADLVKDKLPILKDSKKWSYLLALNMTDEGKTVNHLLPSDTPNILNAKINFLENAITSKRILLEMSSNEDALSFAHVAHKISKRQIFEEIEVERLLNDEPLELKLFGINPLFLKQQESCLLEHLNEKGTLFIQNVHLLSIAMQKKLLDFISYGRYSPIQSDTSVESDVLVICSTNQNLLDLVGRGLFLKELYLELQKSSVWLPSLNALPEDEFIELAEKLRQQLVYSKIYQNLLVFTETDKKKLFASGCVSLSELKTKIQNIILKKTRRQSINETVMDPAYQISDFELVEAARLGKHALKDPKILTTLMYKFKNNQSKVAAFLGVNRSTVSRRCEQHGIQVTSKDQGSSKENFI